jgi:hypothetical protein
MMADIALRAASGTPVSSIWERLTDPRTGKVVGMIRRQDLEAEREYPDRECLG